MFAKPCFTRTVAAALFASAILAPAFVNAWQLKPAPLMTDWAAQVDPHNPWPEYPRPQMVRTNWLNLNGVWQFQTGATNDPVPTNILSGDILVPFPMESALSGVKQHNDRAWYQRTFTVPPAWAGQKLLLHFDAVDWECEPFLNGVSLGIHHGGFDPFTYDTTSFVSSSGPQTLTVRIYDPTDTAVPAIAIGKQSVKFGGYFYTACSGIWQTVWLEPVPTVSIADLKLIPDVNNNRLKVTATVSGVTNGVTVNVTALAGTNVVGTATGSPGAEFTVAIPSPTLWSPTNPYLYNLSVTLQNGATNLDSVASYFGMRKISLGTNGGFVKMLLNDQFVFQLGTLDQGYWPDGVYTAPTDLALRSDIEQTKALGFNLIRKHMKVESPRWYYWADKLGVLVWQDMPATYWTNSPAPLNPQFELELTNMIRSHLNSPAIIVWTVFNEAWGQPDQANTIRICTNVMNLDPSRLVNEASGFNWYDVGHVQDSHIYPAPAFTPSSNKAVACGEFCGVFLAITNHTWDPNGNGVGNYTVANNGDDLTALFQGYCFRLADFAQNHGVSAAVATQITDAETEMNGFFTFDRKIRKPDVNGFQAASFSITTPFTNSIVVSNSQTTAQSWQHTTNPPATNWYAIGFNASAWSNGPAGFGQGVGTIRTPWNTADIWLRRPFNPGALTAQQISNLVLNVFHDEDVEIYVNGVLAAHEAGYTDSYVPLAMTAAAKATIVAGATNVLAVHCHQTLGGQFIDVGIDWRNMASMPTAAAPGTPTGLNAAANPTAVALSWNVPGAATGYNVKRALISGGPYTTIGSPPANGFTDAKVLNGTNYFYVVSAINATGESTNSAEISVTMPPATLSPAAGLYAFEGNALDTSGSGNHGTANGTLAYFAGKIGAQAAQFNGSNSWVSIPLSIGSTNFTIALWIKTTDVGNVFQWYSGKGLVDGEMPGGVNDFGTALCGGKFCLGIGNGDTTLTSVKLINNGLWRHVAATWDAGSGAMKVYVDGVVDGTATGPTGPRNAVTGGLHIGNSHAGNNFLIGALDDVELFGRVLSPLEIAALAGLAVPPAGLQATPGTNQILLQWNGQAGATNYIVSRALDSGGPYTIIGNSGTATNFTDTVVSYGMTYYYAVAAVISGTASANSAPAPAIPLSAYALPTGSPFAKGADVGWVTEMEANNYRWQNRDGTQQDIFSILKKLGVDSIRLRVWVNPVAGYNNKADTIAKAVRAKNAGQRVMIDFHYSDTWADPGTQTKPAAWTNFSTAQLVAAVSNHTADVLGGLLANGVTPEWVQVGNEISCGMLWPDGFTCGATNNTTNFVAMINSGYAAVKAVSPSTRVILHLNNGQNNYRWWFDPVVNLGARFDVIGLSVYPATTTNWIADTTAALANMNDISARYGKEVVIAETGMDVNAAQACQNMLVDLMNKTRSVPNSKGLGLFYWEPEGYAYWGQTAWYNTGRPTIAMDAFAYEPNQPPGSPALFSSKATTKVQLNWTVPVGAAGYKLKRANISGGPYSIIASQSATNFTDTNVVAETPYFYVVSATNIFGEGVNSSEAVGFLTTNAVALYAFEGNTLDTSGSGNHGAANGALTYATGKIGAQAGQFNGSNSWVQIPVSIGGTNFTIAMWIQTTDAGSGGQWYNGEGLVDGEVAGLVNDFGTSLSAGKFALGIGNPDTTLASATSINNGAWRHVAATWDAGSGAMKVYVDGAVNATGSGPTGSRSAVRDNLHVGNSHNGGHYFKGALDQVQLFNRVLSATEIASLAGTALPATPAGLSAAGGNALASLQWNNAIGAASYYVKRATAPGGPFISVTNIFTTGFTDTGLLNETNYYYLVTATNAAGQSASSAIVSVTPHGLPQMGATFMMNGGQLSISWPGWAGGWKLYATPNLTPPVVWTSVTNAVGSTNGLFNVTLPVGSGMQFFRLASS